jgi:ArsR family transcriptional regulator, arsenate/arsenite/antimonite-responsive transcriptional repressor
MVFTRRQLLADRAKLEDVVSRLKALNVSRLHILMLLIEAGPEGLYATQLEEQVSLAQPTISHHLNILVAAGLATSEKRGVYTIFRIKQSGCDGLRAQLGAIIASLPRQR